MIVQSHFKPLWWLTNPHLQTIYASIRHPVCASVDRMQRVELPDGDFLDLLWSLDELPDDAPLVVILHGLCGCVNSSYVPRFMSAFNQRGWRAVMMQFRGAGEEVNRKFHSYHSGQTADLDYVIRLIQQCEPDTKKAIVGVSLGGNVLLKWLGEQGNNAPIDAAVAISVPYELNRVANRINVGFSKLYQKRLLSQMKMSFARKLNHFPEVPEEIKKAADHDCFWTFDHNVTAPLNGFASVHDYYRQSSSKQYLRFIAKPTLLIHAEDDPFMEIDVLPRESDLSDSVMLELSKKGGHVGFIAGTSLGRPVYWLDKRVPEYLEERFSEKSTCEI